MPLYRQVTIFGFRFREKRPQFGDVVISIAESRSGRPSILGRIQNAQAFLNEVSAAIARHCSAINTLRYDWPTRSSFESFDASSECA
jgi:hypothetical protein